MMQVSAGGVVYRIRDDGVIEVKLITTKSWKFSLPKGHVEQGDSVEDTAIREVKEEAGVDAKIEMLLGTAEWKLRSGDTKTVYIYLMKLIKDGKVNDPDNEILKAEWKTLDEAVHLVDFPPMRKLLFYAIRQLNAEKASLCTHCFGRTAVLLDWCEPCLIDGKKQLEKKVIKKALKKE
jgi:8-oxo-dGTP pyrophosphatase MutT (NUDIX family)